MGLCLLALLPGKLVQVRGEGDVVLLPLIVLGEVGLLVLRLVPHLAGEEFLE